MCSVLHQSPAPRPLPNVPYISPSDAPPFPAAQPLPFTRILRRSRLAHIQLARISGLPNSSPAYERAPDPAHSPSHQPA